MWSDGLHRILLVDDEELLRHVMARALEERGFEVVAAADGQEAWSSCRMEPSRSMPW